MMSNFFENLKSPVFWKDVGERCAQVFVVTFLFSFVSGWAGDWSWPAVRALILSAISAAGMAVLGVITKNLGQDKESASVLPFRPDFAAEAAAVSGGADPAVPFSSPPAGDPSPPPADPPDFGDVT